MHTTTARVFGVIAASSAASRSEFDTAGLFAALAVTTMIGLALDWVVALVERRVLNKEVTLRASVDRAFDVARARASPALLMRRS